MCQIGSRLSGWQLGCKSATTNGKACRDTFQNVRHRGAPKTRTNYFP